MYMNKMSSTFSDDSAVRWYCKPAALNDLSLAALDSLSWNGIMANRCGANARSCGSCFCSFHQVSISWFASTRLCRWLVTSSVFTGVEWSPSNSSPSNSPFGKKQLNCRKSARPGKLSAGPDPFFDTKMYGPADGPPGPCRPLFYDYK